MLAFFSYSHIDAESDGPLIAEIHAELEKQTRAAWGQRSFDVWRDVHNLRWGVKWSKALEDAISDCDLFLLLLSPGWLQSPNCRKELTVFKRREESLGTDERVLIVQIRNIPKPLLDSDAQLRALFDELGTRQRKKWMKLADSVEFDRMKMYREAADDLASILFTIKSPEKSREIVAETELSQPRPSPQTAAASGAAASGGESKTVSPEQARRREEVSSAAIGSQLVSFAPGISGELREAIMQSLLLSQLAATTADSEGKGDSKGWVTELVKVLSILGWRVASSSEATLSANQADGDVRKLLEQTLLSMSPTETQEQVRALFHRAVEAAGCAETDQFEPALQLFGRQARTIDGVRFQIAHVSRRESGAVVLHLLAVHISGQIESNGVLFFQWENLTQGAIGVQRFQLTLEEDVFNSVKDLVAQKIAAYTQDYIAALEI